LEMDSMGTELLYVQSVSSQVEYSSLKFCLSE
jgi:hypothetical protein